MVNCSGHKSLQLFPSRDRIYFPGPWISSDLDLFSSTAQMGMLLYKFQLKRQQAWHADTVTHLEYCHHGKKPRLASLRAPWIMAQLPEGSPQPHNHPAQTKGLPVADKSKRNSKVLCLRPLNFKPIYYTAQANWYTEKPKMMAGKTKAGVEKCFLSGKRQNATGKWPGVPQMVLKLGKEHVTHTTKALSISRSSRGQSHPVP